MTEIRVSNEQPPISDVALAEWLVRQFRQVNNALFSLTEEGIASNSDIVNKMEGMNASVFEKTKFSMVY